MTAILNEEEMWALSRKYDLQLKMDVFHASNGYEFRRKVSNGFDCVGVIIGPFESEIYRQKLSKKYVLFHERFWWLGALFWMRFNDKDVKRIPIATMPTVELAKDVIESMICQYILNCDGSIVPQKGVKQVS